jgi:prevent-host-death family protein
MKCAKISQIRDHLSEYLRTVRKGETVIIYDRATPVARLEPVPTTARDAPLSYQKALAAGILMPPRAVDDALQKLERPPKSKQPAQLVNALIEERRAER